MLAYLIRATSLLIILQWMSLDLFADYAGSLSCKGCHAVIFSSYARSGHPFKLNKVDNSAPYYPVNTSAGVPFPPSEWEWSDISYVIGGYAWKARFIDSQGYILTGENKQFNLANDQHNKVPHWVAYDGDRDSSKPYTCGGCHATGWVLTGPQGPHQDNLPGIFGTWKEPGVTCEACHGPSALHAANPSITTPVTEENCANCHARGDPKMIDAADGLIRHHEQYEDLLASPHNELNCSRCHDPHKSTVYQEGGYKGDASTCKFCHSSIGMKINAKQEMACSSCHMPYVVKSALATLVMFKKGSVFKGDIRTHIHRISTDSKSSMFTEDGKYVRVDNQNKAYLTLDYACLTCHTEKDMEWARTYAKQVH